MHLKTHLTFLFLLLSLYFPSPLQCKSKSKSKTNKDHTVDTYEPYHDEETNEKIKDRVWEKDYREKQKLANRRYTLTIYNPGYPRVHGLIVSHHNGLVTGFPDVEVKCPDEELFSPCPRSDHTRTVFHGKLRPVSQRIIPDMPFPSFL